MARDPVEIHEQIDNFRLPNPNRKKNINHYCSLVGQLRVNLCRHKLPSIHVCFLFHLVLLTSPVDRRTIRRICLCIGPSWFVWIRHWRQRCRQIAVLVYSELAFCWFFYWKKTGRGEKEIWFEWFGYMLLGTRWHQADRRNLDWLLQEKQHQPIRKYSFSRMFRILCLFWRSNANATNITHREPGGQKKHRALCEIHPAEMCEKMRKKRRSQRLHFGHANDSSCQLVDYINKLIITPVIF